MVMCGWQTDFFACQNDCVRQSPLFRADGYTAWNECVTAAPCTDTTAGESCFAEAVMGLETRTLHDDYVAACSSALLTCGATLPMGACDQQEVILFSDAYMRGQVLRCFDMACPELVACVQDKVLDAF